MRASFNRTALVAGALLVGAGTASANTFITFSVDMSNQVASATFTPGVDTVSVNGTFSGWAGTNLVQAGSTTVYTNTVNDTLDANDGKMLFKFVINGSNWENPASGQNRAERLPSTSGASLVLPTAFFSDAGLPVTNLVTFQVDVSQQINLGVFTPGVSFAEVRGVLNNWTGGVNVLTNDPSILRTNGFGQVTSNVWVGTFEVVASPAAAEAFKYVLEPGTYWDGPSAVNSNDGGNRYYDNVAQTLPVVDFSDQPYALTANVRFQVDMSAQVLAGAFSNQLAYLAGTFNGWSTTATPLTNDLAAPNTNIYSAVMLLGQGSSVEYKFTYQDVGGTVWESPASTGGGNRSYLVPSTANVDVPPVFWNDFALNDLLTQDTPAFFSVDMNGAIGTDAHVFDPSVDRLFINGEFAHWYPWYGGITPAPAPAGFELFESTPGSRIYTNTIIIPRGTQVGFQYKYGIGMNGDPGPTDDEAGVGTNHFRVIRTLGITPYVMPQDTFGTMYSEPFFGLASRSGGNLTIGAPSGGTIPITWLGRPGAFLQVSTDLSSGVWNNLRETDGTNWTAGSSSANGLVSQTNWPAGGNAYFRLVKPN